MVDCIAAKGFTAMTAPEFLFDGPETGEITIALAHGAGLAMDAPFMTAFAEALGGRGYRVARFEFPYMAERRKTGTKRPPDLAPVLLQCWREVVATLARERMVLAGKSLGGRTAVAIARALENEGTPALACIALGFPFHPPGRPDKLRLDDISAIETPTLVLQGTRDPFGAEDEVAAYALTKAVTVRWLADGEHSFVPRKSSGRTAERNWSEGAAAIDEFLKGLG
jgi:hypothetical protein